MEAAEHADGDITSEHGRELWGRRHGHFPWHRHFPHSHAPVVKAVERAASTVSRVATAAYNFARELYEVRVTCLPDCAYPSETPEQACHASV